MAAVLFLVRPKRGWYPCLDGPPQPPQLELRRHDAHHGDRLAFGAKGAADDVGVATEAPLPQAVANDENVLVPGLSVGGLQRAAQFRRDAEHNEESTGHGERRDAFGGWPISAQDEA